MDCSDDVYKSRIFWRGRLQKTLVCDASVFSLLTVMDVGQLLNRGNNLGLMERCLQLRLGVEETPIELICHLK